jgi:type IV pilus assembly protein PilC
MPYFYWRGVDITGIVKRGKSFARSADHLDSVLFKRHIALMNCRQQGKRYFYLPIPLTQQAHLFKQLAVLIQAGILVPDALLMVSEQIVHRELQEIIHTVCCMVHEGIALSDALAQYPLFDSIITQLIRAGENSGNLSEALHGISDHLQVAQEFYIRLRSALLVPVLTLLFFSFIALIIFIIVIPRFQDLFASLHAQIPPFTQFLLSVSSFIRSWQFPAMLCTVSLLIVVLYMTGKRNRVWWDQCILRLPYIGALYSKRFIAYFFESLALLTNGGIHVVAALYIVKNSIHNVVFKGYLAAIEQEVQAGHTLAEAVLSHLDGLVAPDMVAMIEVGQESGRLPFMLKKISDVYHGQVKNSLQRITLLAQPVLMVIMGLLVTALIFSIYVPILHISQAAH